MLCIHLKNTNPYFCLAAEEYLLKNFDEDIFMLWQSYDTVVVGKHQNALAEINYRFIREKNITVARRISGGGTVFHDAGNVNFSFIKNVKSPAEISFKLFTEPVVNALSKLGITATTSGRNDLLVENLKISGNAEHVYKNRVLHHGTLLFNSDLKNLGNAIKVVPGKYTSKAVESNRSKVANISSFLKKDLKIQDFIRFLIDVQLENKENVAYKLNEIDMQKTEMLVADKFDTWLWNIGYSPKYLFENNAVLKGKSLNIKLNVVKGKIEKIDVSGNFFSKEKCSFLNKNLINKMHYFEDIKNVLVGLGIEPKDELIFCFF